MQSEHTFVGSPLIRWPDTSKAMPSVDEQLPMVAFLMFLPSAALAMFNFNEWDALIYSITTLDEYKNALVQNIQCK